MNQLKRYIAPALIAAALIAAALPGVASASSLEQNGSLVPVGTPVVFSSQGMVIKENSKWGELKCSKAIAEGKVTKNGLNEQGASVFELARQGEGSITGCQLPGGASYGVKEFFIDRVESVKSGVGRMWMRFTETGLPQNCEWYSPVEGLPFTYTPGGSTIVLKSVPMPVHGTNCGTSRWSFQFLTQRANGSAIILR